MNSLNIIQYAATALLLGSMAVYGADNKSPLSLSDSQSEKNTVQITLPLIDNANLIARDALETRLGNTEPTLRFAEPVTVSVSPAGNWISNESQKDNPMSVWRAQIQSKGALSLNLGFSEYYMPEGGALHIYTPGYKHHIRPFTSWDNEDHGELWTPMLPGDTVVIEVNIPTNKVDFLRLNLASVNHGYLGSNMNAVFEQASLLSGSCNVDVVCSEGDNWRKQINSVAAISTGGSLFCTGSALNNTANDGRGFFLTANHCGINSGNAASLVTYWNFQNSTCRIPGSGSSGGNGDGTLTEFNTGAIFRASSSASDFTLVELDDPFDPAHAVYLAGWSAESTLASSAVAIHHPRVDEKRISFENDPVTRTNYNSNTPSSNGTHVRVADWDLGTTEPGSSGSPLFDQNKRVIGQLHGGGAACGNNLSDWYGALSVSWTGGGTNSTRMSNWLDSAGTGELAIDGRDTTGGSEPQRPNASFSYSCDQQNCVFDGSGSTDSDGTINTYSWNFGDGGTGSGINPSHTYVTTGSYSVTLTVTDNDALTDTSTQTVNIGGGSNSGSNLNVNIANKNWFRHTIEIPAGTSRLTVTTSGGSGDADIYINQGSAPTTSQYSCRSWAVGNTESCVIDNPSAGTWHVGIHAYVTVSNVNEMWNYE